MNRSNLFPVDFNIGNIVLEYSGHVHVRELILAEYDQETRLSARTISDDDELNL